MTDTPENAPAADVAGLVTTITHEDRRFASYTTGEDAIGQAIMAGHQDRSRLVRAFARYRQYLRASRPAHEPAGEGVRTAVAWAICRALTPENKRELEQFGNAGPIADAVLAALASPEAQARPADDAGEDRGPAGKVMDALWPILGGDMLPSDDWHEISRVLVAAFAKLEAEKRALREAVKDLASRAHSHLARATLTQGASE